MHEDANTDGTPTLIERDGDRPSLRPALRAVLTNRSLIKAQLALAGARTIDLAQLVVVSTYLFAESGIAAVAAYGVVRTLAPVLGVPVLTALGSRCAPGALLLAMAIVAGVGSLAMAFVIEWAAPGLGILVTAGAVGAAIGSFRPLVRGLLPTLARSPGELVAANATTGFVDSAATLLGPLIGVVVVACVGVPALLALTAMIAVASGLAAGRLTGRQRPVRHGRTRASTRVSAHTVGWRELARNREARLVVLLGTTQTAVRGALAVIVVVFSADVLAAGGGMVGGLHAALGIGGLLILPATVPVVSAIGVHRSVTTGLVLWGTPLVLCAAIANPVAAIGMFAIIGVGDAIVDVGYYGVLQAAIPPHVLTPVLGVAEAMFQSGIAIGAFVGAELLDAFGPRVALVAIGLPLPLLAAATTGRLHSLRQRPVAPTLVAA